VPAPIRSDYATRKEYRWAKKLERSRTKRKARPLLLGVFILAAAAGLATGSLLVYFAVIFLVGPVLAIIAGIVIGLKSP
jgi:hypothetical protein